MHLLNFLIIFPFQSLLLFFVTFFMLIAFMFVGISIYKLEEKNKKMNIKELAVLIIGYFIVFIILGNLLYEENIKQGTIVTGSDIISEKYKTLSFDELKYFDENKNFHFLFKNSSDENQIDKIPNFLLESVTNDKKKFTMKIEENNQKKEEIEKQNKIDKEEILKKHGISKIDE